MRLCTGESRRCGVVARGGVEVECAGHCIWRVRHHRGFLTKNSKEQTWFDASIRKIFRVRVIRDSPRRRAVKSKLKDPEADSIEAQLREPVERAPGFVQQYGSECKQGMTLKFL